MLDTVYPVGSLYMSLDKTSPASIFGGEWERYAKGRTLVGVNEDDAIFASAALTGGEKTHKLTVNEMPRHHHGFQAFWGTSGNSKDTWKIQSATADASGINRTQTDSVGGSESHNNLQPYVTVYVWRRQA